MSGSGWDPVAHEDADEAEAKPAADKKPSTAKDKADGGVAVPVALSLMLPAEVVKAMMALAESIDRQTKAMDALVKVLGKTSE